MTDRHAKRIIAPCFISILAWTLGAATDVQANTQQCNTLILRERFRTDNGYITPTSSAAVANDGSVAVAQPTEGIVRVFNADGREKRILGRPGEGPGEFRSITAVGFYGDTLWVADNQLLRVTEFDSHGELVATRTISGGAGPGYPDQAPSARLSNGDWIIRPIPSPPIAGAFRLRGPLYRVTSDGLIADTLAWINDEHDWVVAPVGESLIVTMFQPYSDNQLWAVLGNDPNLVVVERFAPRRAGPGVYHLVVIDERGDTLSRRSIRYQSRRSSRRDLERLVDGYMRTSRLDERSRSSLVGNMYFPSYVPPVKELLAGQGDALWLRITSTTDSIATWHVRTADGRLLRVVKAADGLRILATANGSVFAYWEDENGNPTIGRFALAAAGRDLCQH